MALYPGLLGAAWRELHPLVRACHLEHGPIRCTGRFAITGRSGLAGLAARLAGLPRPAGEAITVLQIDDEAGVERWLRSFDGQTMITQQYPRGGLLGERSGPWELLFQVTLQEGGLRYTQRAARLCAGPARLAVPAVLAPRVAATELPDENEGRAMVDVRVSMPPFGEVVRYRGWIRRAEAAG